MSSEKFINKIYMKLSHQKDHLSITQFNTVDLPVFTVLTGVNGAGKSHLLQAIENRSVLIDGAVDNKIIHFNYETFRLENEAQVNAQQVSAERTAAWNMLQEQRKANIRKTIESVKNNLGASYSEIKSLCRKNNKSIWELTKEDLIDEALYGELEKYKTNVSNHFNTHNNLKNNAQASSLLVMAKKLQYSLDEITEFEFHRFYEPYTLKSDFLPTQLGKIFADYFSKYELNQYNSFRNKDYGENHDVLTDKEFEDVHGPRPWNIVNEILQTFSSMPYTINTPEQLNRDDGYQVKLIHADKPGVSPEFTELSSGERILMALVASIYKSSSDDHFPDILLLDEVDASLHPSMIQNLLKVINDVFLNKDVNVILVTHSPTTIALTPEESVFLMNRDGEDRIEKRSKADALDILTEGFATLEQGLSLFDEVAKADLAIISEGRNVSFLKKALEMHGITDVEVITGVESKSGKTQLKTLYDFFSIVPHDKKVMIVWDCDARSYNNLVVENKTVPLVLESNKENSIAKKGIENLFPEHLFGDYTKKITMSNGDETTEFDGTRKRDFELFILERNRKEDFSKFDSFIEEVIKLKT